MNRSAKLLCCVLAATACHGASQAATETAPVQQPARPLAQLAAQRVILTPAYSLAQGDALGWAASVPRSREYLRSLDDELAKELGERGLTTRWTWPADLVKANKANPTYAVDPYALGANVLLGTGIVSGTKLGDPLATQVRTMVAIQEGARAVVIPIELRFEKQPSGQGVAVLRVALVDGRLGDVRWIGTVRSDPASVLSRAMLTSIAVRFADLVTAP